MKIIKKYDTATWSYNFTCSSCETEMEVEKSDLKYVYDFRDGDYVTFSCPTCKRDACLIAKFLPKAIILELAK